MARLLNVLIATVAFVPCAFTAPGSTKAVCQKISSQISSQSAVLYADDPDFATDIHHWFLSSSHVPACVVEVGSAEDTSTALKIIGQTKTPFAAESGGHASNPGFSSTKGVHISMKRLDGVTLSSDKKTATIGFGQTWADVFEKLESSGVNVVGGRTQGPAVGGFTLGGGFSWKTNQHGLTCDTVQSYTLVLPNGTISTIDSSQSDLFFALKGGLNRFGIVTSAEFATHPQPDPVYAGFNIYTPDKTDAVTNATAKFYKENTDPKTQIITTLGGSTTGTSTLVLFFHDGPTSPPSFETFNEIVPLTLVQNVRPQSFSSFVSGIPSQLASVVNTRGTFDTLSTSSLTTTFIEAVKKEADTNGELMLLHGGLMASYDIEPFDSKYGKFATNSAYPHDDSPLPLNLYFSWTSASYDAFWFNAMKTSIQRLIKVAQSEGIYVAPKYPNYAITGTTSQQLYGSANAARLERIRAQVDPDNVMELAGGFKI